MTPTTLLLATALGVTLSFAATTTAGAKGAAAGTIALCELRANGDAMKKGECLIDQLVGLVWVTSWIAGKVTPNAAHTELPWEAREIAARCETRFAPDYDAAFKCMTTGT